MVSDCFISDSTLRTAAKTPEVDPPVRETMKPGEYLGEQFAGLTGEPEDPKARRTNYVAGQSIHEYRTSPGSSL